jgi:hypothetical protein
VACARVAPAKAARAHDHLSIEKEFEMLYESLQAVIGAAVIDPNFRRALLNGSRPTVAQSFNLTSEEAKAIMAIRAETLEQFAGELDRWISKKRNVVEPPALMLSSRPNTTSRPEAELIKEPARIKTPLSAHLCAESQNILMTD